MKNTFLSLITCLAVSTASAVDVASVVNTLGSDDYAARLQARIELTQAFALATAPEMPSGDRQALVADVIAQLNATGLPLTGRLYLIRMLELYGTDAAADAVYPLLGDSEAAVRDSARRALAAIPGDKATGYLLNGFSSAPEAERPAYMNALAEHRAVSASVEIAELLRSDDSALVASAALALGKLGDASVVPQLIAARDTASASAKPIVEVALIEVGLDADTAYKLAGSGSNFVIRGAAFEQLMTLDASRALQVLQSVFAKPDFAGRTLFLEYAVGAESVAIRDAVIAHLSDANESDQMVIVAAIGADQLSVYEPEVLALLPNSTGLFRATIIDTLGTIGGDASFEALYQAFMSNTKDQNTANAVARLKAPSADQTALDTLKQGSDMDARIASMKVLELRNTPGATELLNNVAFQEGDVTLREAAFKSLEVVGDLESVQQMTQLVVSGGPMMRSGQRSLKRLSLNVGAPDNQWNLAYLPALQSAADDSARENLVLILDAVPGQQTLNYLKTQSLDTNSALRSASIKTLERWPNADSNAVWIDFATTPGASESDVAKAEKMIKKFLQQNDRSLDSEQINLAVRAIQTGPNAVFKQNILSVYETPNRRQIGRIKQEFKSLESDLDVGPAVTALLSRI